MLTILISALFGLVAAASLFTIAMGWQGLHAQFSSLRRELSELDTSCKIHFTVAEIRVTPRSATVIRPEFSRPKTAFPGLRAAA